MSKKQASTGSKGPAKLPVDRPVDEPVLDIGPGPRRDKGRQIPSFFTFSRVTDDHEATDPDKDTRENIKTDYDSIQHVRIMKSFCMPTPERIKDKEERAFWDDPSQKHFYVRVYLPKKKIVKRNPDSRINQVVIMFNGLNECERFDFYDVLGAQFADNGIASILLPTAFHLNRRVPNTASESPGAVKHGDGRTTWGSRVEPNTKAWKWPTDIAMDEPMKYFFSFRRSLLELEYLVDCIKKPENHRDEDLGFYESYFTRNPEITLFGFSLGGLRALSAFMKDPDTYHACVSFNTGPKLKAVNVDALKLDHTLWEEAMSKLEKQVRSHKRVQQGDDNDSDNRVIDFFECFYMGYPYDDVIMELRKLSLQYLAIQSGGDLAVKLGSTDYIADPKHGLNRMIVAGVDHIPTVDPRWEHWLSKVGENIIHFIRGIREENWARSYLEDHIRDILYPTAFFQKQVYQAVRDEDPEAMKARRARILEYFSIDRLQHIIRDIKLVDENKAGGKGYAEVRTRLTDAAKADGRLGLQEDRFVDTPMSDLFLEFYYLSKAFYPNFPELLWRISKWRKSDVQQ